MAASSTALAQEITAHLVSKSLPPTPSWLTTFLSSTRPNTPLPALKQTALFRLLASDITTSVQASASSVFPADVHNAQVVERRLPGPIPAQVLDVEDVGSSRWSQVEKMEALERGEMTKGREVVRLVPGETEDGAAGDAQEVGASASAGPHKVVLQDARGARVYGIEVIGVEGLGVGMNIGCKVLLRDVVVARGVLLLEPRCVMVLGGKIEGVHRAWREGRKERLRRDAGMEGGG